MNKALSLLYKIPGSLLLGCIVALGLMQNDPWLKRRIEQMLVASVSELVKEPFHVTVTGIDLLRGKIISEHISVSCSKGEWAFQCPEMHFELSWLSWFKGKGFDTTMTLYNPTVFTQYDRSFAVEQPFNALVNAPIVLPVNLVSCAAKQGTVTIVTDLGELAVHCDSTTSIEPQMVLTKIICTDGQAVKNDSHTLFAQDITGKMSIDVPRTGEPYKLVLHLSCMRHHRVERPYQLYYGFADNKGKFTFRSDDGSCSIEADDITYGATTKADLTVMGTLGELASLVVNDEQVGDAQGKGSFKGELELTDTGYTYQGQSAMTDASYKGVEVSQAALLVKGDQRGLDAQIKNMTTNGMELQGKCKLQFGKGLSGALSLIKPYEGLPYGNLEKARADFEYTQERFTATVKTRGQFIEGASVPLKGSITTDFKTAKAQGTFAGNPFVVVGEVAPFKLTKVSLQDPLHMTRVDLSQNEGILQGTIDSLLIKKILQALTGYQLHGDANAQIKT